jgi:protein LTV1
VPDVLAGFQPNMDPRLREVLEALEDEAYVDDDEDVFCELVKNGAEVPFEEFVEEEPWEEEQESEDVGWETDDTAKPDNKFKTVTFSSKESAGDVEMTSEDARHGNGDWMAEFSKYKKAERAKGKPQPSNSELQSSIITSSSTTGTRRKKRKGALTSTTNYSMTSSSLFRTEGLRTLDDRFEKVSFPFRTRDSPSPD